MTSQHLGAEKFTFVPIVDWTKDWSDSELYTKYGLTAEEIKYVEATIKPLDTPTLFSSDEYLDPNFGTFDLLECGVKEGDMIVYTPIGIEMKVVDNNKVECDGSILSLAEFTAKYMPRNKRSVSGVCQGPKYFSFNGVTLYQMKESFLGGKK